MKIFSNILKAAGVFVVIAVAASCSSNRAIDNEKYIADLDKRIRTQEDIESIKQLKSRYLRSIDTKQFDILKNCYTKDGQFEIVSVFKLEGNDKIAEQLAKSLGTDIYVHQWHSAEIEIIGDSAAKALFYLEFHGFNLQQKTFVRGWGYYTDELVKENGDWKIKKSQLKYSHHENGKS